MILKGAIGCARGDVVQEIITIVRQATQREAVQIWKMIVDFDRYVQLLNCDITTEEQRARISDRSDPAYPILARMRATRRDNLKDTITALERRLSKLDRAELVAEPA
jgi:hypothetical protein